MTKVSAKSMINASANDVWKTIRSFDRVERFLPIVTSSTVEGSGVGAKWTCSVQFGAGQDTTNVIERLDNLDEDARILRYTVTDAPAPFGGLVNTISVRNLGNNKCEVEWSGTFESKGNSEAEMKKTLEEIYLMALDGLKELHEN